MKRTVPLLITAIAGFVLIFSFFIPYTEGWGEEAAIWFDILAAIAFVLGGGNLLKINLKKTSDRAPGWGYSVITLVAFLATLLVGLTKWGSPPAVIQEFYGETFADLALASFPDSQVARVEGSIPPKANDEPLASSVRTQLFEDGGTVAFRGWMRKNQRDDLLGYKQDLEWQCTVERLHEKSKPPPALVGKVAYYADHEALSFKGPMTPAQRDALLAMSDNVRWTEAVNSIYDRSQAVTEIAVGSMPAEVEIPESLQEVVAYDAGAGTLSIRGPMSAAQRDALTLEFQFPRARPLDGEQRAALRRQIEAQGGPLNPAQVEAFNKTLDGTWTVALLRDTLNTAGEGQKTDKTACEMLAEREAGVVDINPKNDPPPDVTLTPEQVDAIASFAGDPAMTFAELQARLKGAGELTDRQAEVLEDFLSKQATVGERGRMLAFAMLAEGALTEAQRDLLLDDYREQARWRGAVGELFVASHDSKYGWSGSYRAQGSPFWWLYEYAFKPLTATMFAMLAFYVASAAFRAFRAKNLEATLLLGTAFIILLGRTFAGVWLTSFIPEDGAFAGLRMENLTVYIMQVFNTAGNRAIMIGIALGIASTSLKVLLGVDRSYLGKE